MESVVHPPRQRIVVGIDGSPGARAALVWALTAAGVRGADVEAVTAFPVDFYWSDAYLLDPRRIDTIRSDTASRARAMIEETRQEPAVAGRPGAADVDVRLTVVAGPPAAHLVQRSGDADLLVVGSRGRGGLRSAAAGSVALHCSAHAACPVVVVHPSAVPATEPPRVVVGLDNTEHARAALAAAVEFAGPMRARVDAVLAYEAPNYWSDLYAVVAPPLGESREHALRRGEDIVADVLGSGPVERGGVRVVAVEGHPGQVLVHAAQGARLLVVGSRSRNQLQGVVLGSVALHCVLHGPCPVLVVHPRGQRHGYALGAVAVPTSG